MRLAVFLSMILCAVPAAAQRGDRHEHRDRGRQQSMSPDERQRMRDDMRDVYRERRGRPDRQQREMSPQERDKLRDDIRDANQNLKRR